MAQELDVGKFDRTAWVLMACGVAAFIDTFLPWASVNVFGAQISGSAWTVGFWAWFPMLLLLAVGVAAFLPGIGVSGIPDLPVVALAVSALALVIVLIRWATYPSIVGAGAGLIIGIVLALVAGGAAYMTDATRAAVAKLRNQSPQPAQPSPPQPAQPSAPQPAQPPNQPSP